MTELFLVAAIDGRGIAFDADRIDAVIDLGEIVAVPRVDPTVRGLAALRSRVATVLDLRLLLGLPAAPATARRAVTAQIDGHLYAFLVDALEDIAALGRQPLATGVALAPRWRQAAVGMVERDGEPLLIIDLATLIRDSASLAA